MHLHRLRPALAEWQESPRSAAHRTKGGAEEAAAAEAVTHSVSRSCRERWSAAVRADRADGPGGHRVQAEGLTLQGDGEAVAVLDQGEELALFAGGGAGGVVRAGHDIRPCDVGCDVPRLGRAAEFRPESKFVTAHSKHAGGRAGFEQVRKLPLNRCPFRSPAWIVVICAQRN